MPLSFLSIGQITASTCCDDIIETSGLGVKGNLTNVA